MSTTFSKKFLPFILPNGIIYLRMIYPRNPVRPAGNSGKLHSAEVTMSTLQIVLLVILVILIIALVLLYRYGNKMQKLQAEQQEMLDAMTGNQREVFVLYYQYGYTQPEIAAKLGIAKQSVNERLRSALERAKRKKEIFL